ncbi:hypothetical protein AT727_02550 [Desulfitobacterium hafniense]|uniref:N-acetyltransferase domain-containing protein n=1 Tax=Desulfitobacterium hafniense TaxID=49338 RepID=A0A0W1JRF4_DESHA|nr:GNAT family N-acetyltransferase [Desulfitobacterium hafniense]KTE93855.1 hypothetical protein AT727_02550 [Desulfitobacterium hafniense]
MKIIDAFWEKRNLGVSATEVVVEINDEVCDIVERLKTLTTEYNVVKLPVCRVDVSFALSKLGFSFIETMNHLTHDMRTIPLDSRKIEIFDSTDFLPMENEDIQTMYSNIRKGLYKTDRIYFDSYFTPQQSANRYIGWISDELERGSEIYKLVYNGECFGFVGFKKIREYEYQNFIYGIYPPFQGKGLAFNMTYKLVDELKVRGVKAIYIDISSNNIPSLQASIRYGYMFNSFTYIFVKHK